MATKPPQPAVVDYWDIAQDHVDLEIRPRGDGGSPILEYQVGFGRSPIYKYNIVSTDIKPTISNLAPAVKYYFWSRVRNAVGWSPWSTARSFTTRAGAWVKIDGKWRKAIPYVKHNGSWKVAQPYIKYRGYWEEANS